MAEPVTPLEIKTRFPEFSNLADSFIQAYIDEATTQLIESRWGRYYRLGIMYLTAHLMALANRASSGQTAGGIISSQSVGDTSVSFTVPGAFVEENYFFSQTPYGLRYIELARIPGAGPAVA